MGKDGFIKQWDADGFRLIQILTGHQDEINMGLVSYNGDMVCSVGKDKSIRLWERSEEVVVLEDEERKRREEEAKNAYEWAITRGIAKEQARVVLPEGLTMSRMYMNGTLRSWIHYIELRSANGTQKEHMDVARACAEVIADIFPLSESFVEKE